MANDKIDSGEQAIELTKLMVEFSNALAATAEAMDNAFATRPELKDRPVVYQIPRMSVSVKMSLSYTQGKIRGLLFAKDNTTQTQEVTSTINMDFVAVPRQSIVSSRRTLFYSVPTTSGNDVLLLQLKLQEYGRKKDLGLVIVADGEYGLQTEQAVKRFQRVNGLPETGVVNDTTYDKLLTFALDPAKSEEA